MVRAASTSAAADIVPQTFFLARHIIGWDCYAREKIYENARRWLRKEDRIGACCIDNVLWDLAGKRSNVSVSTLLGGEARKRLPAYASTWFAGDGGGLATPEDFADFAEECYSLGYRAFKMHGWTDGDARRDAAAIRLLGKRVGGRMKLMHDSACHLLTFADARLRASLRRCRFLLVRGPLQRRRPRSPRSPQASPAHQDAHPARGTCARRRGHGDPGAGRRHRLRPCRPRPRHRHYRTMEFAHFSEALGLDVEIHGNGPAHRHAMAAIRNTNFYELAMVGPSRGQAVGTYYTDGLLGQARRGG